VHELVRGTDTVYHLAAAVGVHLVVEELVSTIETNVHGTSIVLRYASRYRKPTLVVSTSEVYGKSTKPKFSESDDRVMGPTDRGRWAYAASKALDEFLALAYWKTTRLPVVIVRLFNTVGPRQTGRYGMVVPRFVRAALLGEPLSVYGDGKQTRCFCDVSDVVPALVKLMETREARGQVFNVGSNERITIADLARRVVERTGSKSEIQFVPYDQVYGPDFEDMEHRAPDLDKIRSVIGFKPTVSLDRIVDRVAEDIRRRGLGG
jgi:UDP-glucose 4-epimerase